MTEQFQRPAHGDLRVNVAPDPLKSEVSLFKEMMFEDWPDANVKDAFDYLYHSKHCRIGWVRASFAYVEYIPIRIPIITCPGGFPPEGQPVMKEFKAEWDA